MCEVEALLEYATNATLNGAVYCSMRAKEFEANATMNTQIVANT